MMEGFDTRWNEAGTKREATYTNLSPGRYTFRVKASNNDGFWNETGASIFIRVKPPWYKNWWFYIVVVLSVLGFFALFYLIRTAQLRKQKDLLAMKVNERTRELSEKNEELKTQAEDLNNTNALMEERQQLIEEQAKKLEQANEELKKLNSSKDKFFSIISHDLRGPFQNILGFSEILSDNYADMDETQKKDIADNINVSTKRVYHLLENLLKWSASQINSISYIPDNIDIEDIISESIHIMKDIAVRKKIRINFSKIEVEKVFADREMVKTIVRNLIGNALKFTLAGGMVDIEVTKTDGFAHISVRDNGIGMDKKYMQNLFSIEKMESRAGTENERGSGLGLILCREFVEKNGGKLTVKSKKGLGSTFSFTLPLPSEPD
jgi:signal transduction histidine kinase